MACPSTGCTYFSAGASFYRQSLALVSRCSQRSVARLPAAGTSHTGVRPWEQRHRLTEKGGLAIELPGHLCDPTGARADGGINAGSASYPREVLRGERPKRVLVPFDRAKGTPSGKRPHQAGKPELGRLEEQLLHQPDSRQPPFAKGRRLAWWRSESRFH